MRCACHQDADPADKRHPHRRPRAPWSVQDAETTTHAATMSIQVKITYSSKVTRNHANPPKKKPPKNPTLHECCRGNTQRTSTDLFYYSTTTRTDSRRSKKYTNKSANKPGARQPFKYSIFTYIPWRDAEDILVGTLQQSEIGDHGNDKTEEMQGDVGWV